MRNLDYFFLDGRTRSTDKGDSVPSELKLESVNLNRMHDRNYAPGGSEIVKRVPRPGSLSQVMIP